MSSNQHNQPLTGNEIISDEVNAMLAELQTNQSFLPSKFWDNINSLNYTMLSQDGIQNFKRTLSQNYFNFLITRPFDPPFISAFRLWLRSLKLRIFRTKIETPLRLRTVNGTTTLNWVQREVYKLYVAMLWEIVERADTHHVAQNYRESELGNPIRITRDNQLLTQDAANSVIECNEIISLLTGIERPRIAEIGAGYGRVAHAYVNSQPGKYFIFDIAPALYVSQWYIQGAMPEKKVFKFRAFKDFSEIREELDSADIAFFTANQIEKFPPGYFDLVLTISTLPEMTAEQVKLYEKIFSRISSGFIFLKQWQAWVNPSDGTSTRIDSYDFGDKWEQVYCRPDIVDPRFYIRALRRTAS